MNDIFVVLLGPITSQSMLLICHLLGVSHTLNQIDLTAYICVISEFDILLP